MNPIAKAFHTYLLITCVTLSISGLAMMFIAEYLGEEPDLMFIGAALALGFGALSCLPLFYFSAQAARKRPKETESSSDEEE